MFSMIVFGFLLGLRHALEADHVATVATLATTETNTKQVLTQGLAWGLGHSATLLIVGMIVLGADTMIPEHVALWLERGVGVMMILLALDVLRRLFTRPVHVHQHQHDDGHTHVHLHSHSTHDIAHHDQSPDTHHHAHQQVSPVRATVVGIIHGLAGSAAVVLLFADRIDSFWEGLAYLLCFGIGSIVGMALFSLALSVPMRMSAQYLTRVHRWLQAAIAFISAAIGISLLAL